MSDCTQITSKDLNIKSLGVLLYSSRRYVDILKAKQFVKYFLSEIIDEPVLFLRLRNDANSKEISKEFKGLTLGVTEKQLLLLNPRNTILINFTHAGIDVNDKLNEILCNRYSTKFLIDTNLK